MLWFKLSLGAKFLKMVQFLFLLSCIKLLLQSGTMANEIETSSKNIKPRINLNHTTNSI